MKEENIDWVPWACRSCGYAPGALARADTLIRCVCGAYTRSAKRIDEIGVTSSSNGTVHVLWERVGKVVFWVAVND